MAVDIDAGKVVFGGELEMVAGLLGTQAGGEFLRGTPTRGTSRRPSWRRRARCRRSWRAKSRRRSRR